MGADVGQWVGSGLLTLGLLLVLVQFATRPRKASAFRRRSPDRAAGAGLLGLSILLGVAVVDDDPVAAGRTAVPLVLLVLAVMAVRRAPRPD